MTIERGLNARPLHTPAAAVHQTHFPQARSSGGIDVLADDGGNLGGEEAVKIDLVLDWDADRLVLRHDIPP